MYKFSSLIFTATLLLSACVNNKTQEDSSDSVNEIKMITAPEVSEADSTGPFRIFDGEAEHKASPEEMRHHASKGISTLEDAYMAGYDDGYEDGEEDGGHGADYGRGYDPDNDLTGKFAKSYEDGYDAGYYDGYHTNYRGLHDDLDEDDDE